MRSFINRLKDRGWKNENLRGLTNNDLQLLCRGNEHIVFVENINVDPTEDLNPQIDSLFQSLIEIIKKSRSKEIFLPGRGNILIPIFFQDFCLEKGINIRLISLDSFQELLGN